MRECVIPSVLDRRRDEAYFAEDGLCVQGVFSYENVRKQFLSDVLGIPLREIREVRVATPFLWKRHARQKQIGQNNLSVITSKLDFEINQFDIRL